MAETMKAAVWHDKNDIRVEDVAVPGFPQPGEVKIKELSTGKGVLWLRR
jgi:(R,R)-butanediol dehydrogenase/meso-butanediol dehydrogenase/diacetyl reductase